MKWMIYGATGYTGQLVIEEALRRGHRPIIAGRNPEKLASLAQKHGLDYVAFTLDDVNTVAESIAEMDIVYHAAGPFIHTSETMIEACLATNTHYLDISGEIDVFERSFSYDSDARNKGIAIISGVGFDVVPTDCLGASVAAKVPDATHLQTGVMGFGGAGLSAGTTISTLEMLPKNWWARRDGELINTQFADKVKRLKSPEGKTFFVVSVPWGDLSAAYRTTGIPNIISYMSMNPILITLGQVGHPLAKLLLKNASILNFAKNMVNRFASPPTEQARKTVKSYIWAKASNVETGQSAEAWLETLEPYQYTAKLAPLVVEALAENQIIGALSPAQAFGSDFTMKVLGTRRL